MAKLDVMSDNFDNNSKEVCINLKRKCGQASSNGKYLSKRKRKADGIVLPTKFLLGGNINDPLNLASLSNASNQVTPKSSPIPTPKHKKEIEVLIPENINDPLSLNTDEDIDQAKLITFKAPRKSKRRKRKRTDSETTLDEEDEVNETVGQSVEKPVSTSNLSSTLSTSPSASSVEINTTVAAVSAFSQPSTSFTSETIEKHTNTKSANYAFRNRVEDTKSIKVEEKRTAGSRNNRQPQTQHRFRPKDVKFQYGNYNRYYGYRNVSSSTDLRLKQFEKDWFNGLNVLDIGCNVGHVTLKIAKDFLPEKIVGLDIDENLIRVAKKNIRHYLDTNKESKQNAQMQIKSSVNSESLSLSSLSSLSSSSSSRVNNLEQVSELDSSNNNLKHNSKNLNSLNESKTDQSQVLESKESNQSVDCSKSDLSLNSLSEESSIRFPENVNFVVGNYVLETDEQLKNEKEEYDCILCLSVTKWIHLNFGDSGLKRAFKRMYAQLKPGGKLILEPQPWCSYKKKKFLTVSYFYFDLVQRLQAQ